MGKYFLTGHQGSGKTTTLRRMNERGIQAYDIESVPGIMRLEHLTSGEFIDWPEGRVDWTSYGWNIQDKPLSELLGGDGNIFFGAVTSNQRRFYPKFDMIFALIVEADTLLTHLQNHEHMSHRDPAQLEQLLSWRQSEQQAFIRDGAIPIIGGRPVDLIIDDVLSHITV